MRCGGELHGGMTMMFKVALRDLLLLLVMVNRICSWRHNNGIHWCPQICRVPKTDNPAEVGLSLARIVPHRAPRGHSSQYLELPESLERQQYYSPMCPRDRCQIRKGELRGGAAANWPFLWARFSSGDHREARELVNTSRRKGLAFENSTGAQRQYQVAKARVRIKKAAPCRA